MNTCQPPQPTARALTGWSLAGLLLLLPTVVLAWVAVLATERGSRCLMYGEQCSAVPGGALWGCFGAAPALGAPALAWPRTRWTSARAGAVALQWGAQLMLGALILSGA
ncbi:hypothetical protein H0H10_28075 [Streptomyces sp. TRM S81-3]|uniref:Transmembrane protein n=1 Tax=Streptomyces griseicoloratus TaxID=2752516 RepID=A0A926LA83_9ACTN|nr:hypothetical protein [Streptomyces griseicoloratus]MBD0422967.1 hypothetical protein [Streptomyces griseicoloratus]